MGIATRFYIFLEDGSLRRLPQRIGYELPFGRDAIPEFAGTRQRVATVLVESEAGKPVQILDSRGLIWAFNAEGRIDDDVRQQRAEHVDVLSPRAASKKGLPVVDLVPEIKRRAARARYEWTLSVDDLDRIAADIWPGIHGPAPEVASVKGTKPRKPALTHEGRWALERIEKHVSSIAFELRGLPERSLKGLAFEALRMGSQEEEDLWRGVADEAKKREAIRAAYRTGKGEWVAIVEVPVAATDPTMPHALQHVATVHERCATREAAIEAGRRLMAEKVEWLGAETYVEATICSALEGRPDD